MEGQKAIFVPVLFSSIAGQPGQGGGSRGKRCQKELALSWKLPSGPHTFSALLPAIPVTKRKLESQVKTKHSTNFLLCFFCCWQTKAFDILQAETIFNNSHLLIHIPGYMKGHTALSALIINLIVLSKYQLSRIFTEDMIPPVTPSSQTAQKQNNWRTLWTLLWESCFFCNTWILTSVQIRSTACMFHLWICQKLKD